MNAAYIVLTVLGVLVAALFSALVLLTGKGDAMSGGSSVRTTFKGKASFDDYISQATLILGISFLTLMVILDTISNRMAGR